jgi:Tripartite tricarboxylate transporter TctB family
MAPSPPRDKAKRSLGPDLIIPGIAVCFTLYYFTTVWDLSWEAKSDGLAIGWILLLLIAIFLAKVGKELWRGQATLSLVPLLHPRSAQAQRLALVVAIVVFILVLPYLGFTLATALFMVAAMLILGVRNAKSLMTVSTCVAGGGYLLFIAFLDTRFPRGPIEQFLKWLF